MGSRGITVLGVVAMITATTAVAACQGVAAGEPVTPRLVTTEGLLEAARVIARERIRDPRQRALLLVLTDGRATAGEDGIAKVGATLDGRSGIAAVHLVSHGSDGTVKLGSTQLDGTALFQRAGEIAAWSAALGADADLLIYGCGVAAGSEGQALVHDLAALTGADVAALDRNSSEAVP